MVPRPASAGNPFLSSFASCSLRRDRTYLFNNFGSRIDLINDREEAGNLCFVAWHHLELVNEVFPLGSAQERQLVNIMAVSEIVHFESVLLELECLQQLVYRDVRQLQVLLRASMISSLQVPRTLMHVSII